MLSTTVSSCASPVKAVIRRCAASLTTPCSFVQTAVWVLPTPQRHDPLLDDHPSQFGIHFAQHSPLSLALSHTHLIATFLAVEQRIRCSTALTRHPKVPTTRRSHRAVCSKANSILTSRPRRSIRVHAVREVRMLMVEIRHDLLPFYE